MNNTYLRKIQAGVDDILDARFLLLLMGFFAFYCGLIYNDFLSMPWNLFGTCWKRVEGGHETKLEDDCIYPIGDNSFINFEIYIINLRFGSFMVCCFK